MSILRLYFRVLALLAPERALALALALANLGLAGVLYLEPMLFGRVVDALGHPDKHNAMALIGVWALVGLAGAGIGVVVSLYGERMAYRRRMAAIRLYFAHALSLPMSYHTDHHTGRLLRIMSIGTDNLFTLWLGFFREHLATVLTILVLLPFAFLMNWEMALLMVALLISFAVFNAIAIRRTGKAQGEVQESYNQIATRASDVLGNVSVVQSFTRTRAEIRSLKKLTARALAAQYPVLTGWATLSVFSRTASTLTIVAIFALGTTLHAKGAISIGGIVSFVGFALMLIGRLEQFATFISNLFFQAPAMRDYFEVLDTQASIRELPGAPRLAKVRGEVAFEHVDFGYDSARPMLHDLTFRVRAGTRVAVVGPTGAGKTTALSLLYRGCDPDRGRITIDGRDIRSVSLDSLRRNISVVFQEPGLLHRSIRENLKVGNPHADAATLEAAARAAEAEAFINEKPQAYATPVSERGRSLSGGERQRIAIARAMLKDAPILILDEATSALDNATEAHIQCALDTLSTGRTTFVIAHRLSTVRNADLVLVIDHGHLVEQGRYDELIRRGGLFAQLAGQGRFVPDAQQQDHAPSIASPSTPTLDAPPPRHARPLQSPPPTAHGATPKVCAQAETRSQEGAALSGATGEHS